jgi:simple sugar transport system permease protein
MNHKKKIFKSYESFLLLLLIVFVLIIGLINPAFFSVGTLFDVIRNQTIYILLAFGMLPVVILGGFDVSFGATAALATFFARVVLTNLGFNGGIWQFYAVSIFFGIMTGMMIGWLIWSFKLSIFDLSLGITSLINGFLVLISNFVHSKGSLTGFKGWNMKWLVTVQSVVGKSGLHVSFLLVVAAFVGMYLFLRHTTLGRSIYATGSDRTVAIRTGINIKKIYMVVFAILGAMGAIAGVTGSGLGTRSFGEKYMQVYATVIIGGASVRGGRGSVFGTLLGVLLVGLISQALVYVKIPTAWGDAVLGVIFIGFTLYETIESRLKKAA